VSALNFGSTKSYWLPKLFCEWHWQSGNGETDTILETKNHLTHVQLDCSGFDDMLSNAFFYKSTLFTDRNQTLVDCATATINTLQEIGAPVPDADVDRWCLDCSRWTKNNCESGGSS
jgi:hypothetical protein